MFLCLYRIYLKWIESLRLSPTKVDKETQMENEPEVESPVRCSYCDLTFDECQMCMRCYRHACSGC